MSNINFLKIPGSKINCGRYVVTNLRTCDPEMIREPLFSQSRSGALQSAINDVFPTAQLYTSRSMGDANYLLVYDGRLPGGCAACSISIGE